MQQRHQECLAYRCIDDLPRMVIFDDISRHVMTSRKECLFSTAAWNILRIYNEQWSGNG